MQCDGGRQEKKDNKPAHLEDHELSSLLRFSLRFRRSTRLRCIFSAIFS